MTFRLPYVLIVTDGNTIRTVHPPALGLHRTVIESALADLLDMPPAPVSQPSAAKPEPRPATAAMMTQGEIARAQGYTGDCCDACGQFTMKRHGACLSCDSCGTTTGCS